MNDEPEILFEAEDGMGRILLNRPKALNALTLGKIREMDATLRRWADSATVKMVLIEGAGDKAFCAGGDIRALAEAARVDDQETIRSFFSEEYALDRLIRTFPKPYVAVLNGITMGGGVGISLHGSHRVATENTLFAMPETGIGLFPDVGGTYALPRLPGHIGTYLGLTGARLGPADCLYAEVATHHVPTERLPEFEAALRDAARNAVSNEEVVQALTDVMDLYHDHLEDPPLEVHREAIDEAFGRDTVEEILETLDAMDTAWGKETAAVLRTKSPTSLKVSLRQMRAGLRLDFDRAMQLEYRLARRFLRAPDFQEGVRAVIVDKDQAPRWSPATLEAVTEERVRAWFAPLDDEPDLSFR
ncbi:enoyl-CoA hydratase/isomerase family protein [Roseospira visakhapatnamensis]|uniref:3-hydroxyisobutyryl-CoA hydrolase n=1 Tax=Roseospira visakhapatnamensis TaxID=390880 RepID=A0A7W6RBE0_9PROT|nr:enoyl-CoA hydratase/isomerase family protein [Roseospira visakhapatnamensis]MBB4264824.1 enoyl-CoA hydratase [Roseospira visakhapatnamensis]